MRIERIGLSSDLSKVKTKVYDVEKKELLGVFESRAEASRFTGVANKRIQELIRNKTRCSKNKLNRTICFR